jgi:hypothetical protein
MNAPTVTSTAPLVKAPSLRATLVPLVWEVGLPLLAYFGLRWLGASAFPALLGGSVTALVRVLYVVARTRRVDVFAAFMVVVFGVGVALAFVTGDPKFLLVKESFGTMVAGLLLLGSCVFGRPLIFHAARRLVARSPEADAAWEQRWRTVPQFRRAFGLMSAVWGAGLLAEALLRIALVFVLPTDVMVGVSSAMLVSTMIALSIWNGAYARRLMARARQASAHN